MFDTAFYADLPLVAHTYALPRGLAAEHGIRRYGFHGIAHTAMRCGWSGQGRAISLQLGGAEAVLFGGGVGENAGEVRSRILSGLEWAGIRIDEERNAGELGSKPLRISENGSAVAAWVVPVDKERILAEEAAAVIGDEPVPAARSGGTR